MQIWSYWLWTRHVNETNSEPVEGNDCKYYCKYYFIMAVIGTRYASASINNVDGNLFKSA